jgi:hypothetical protein
MEQLSPWRFTGFEVIGDNSTTVDIRDDAMLRKLARSNYFTNTLVLLISVGTKSIPSRAFLLVIPIRWDSDLVFVLSKGGQAPGF